MFIEDIKIGDTLYFNTFGPKGIKVSKICKVIDIKDDQPVILLRNAKTSFPAFPTKLSLEPQFRVTNISRDQIEEYINESVDNIIKENMNYTKSYAERLNKYYDKARVYDSRRGW